MLLAQGDLAAAARWTQENGLNEDDEPDYAREPGHLVLARLRLAEQLTSRELEVLTMLAAGRPNQATASQLIVTLDTVKKHVSHVLGKLGAANRTDAVSRARELSLIP